jgi:DNA-binding MarR family transcriptional regulator
MDGPRAFPGTDAGNLAAAVERFLFTVVRQRGTNDREAGSLLLPTQTAALCAIVDEGPLRLGALAEQLGTTAATATRTADSLEALGLIERVPDARDGRATLLAPTERGRRGCEERRARLLALLERAVSASQHDEVAHFTALFEQLDALVDPLHHRDVMHGPLEANR